MIKKFLAIILLILFTSNSSSGNIENEYNLFIDGSPIDFKAAELAHEKLNGGHYNKDLRVVIPADVFQTEVEWKKAKDLIAFMIGPLPHLPDQEHLSWENSSKDIDNLLRDAIFMAPFFKKDFENIATRTGVIAYFGPHDRNLVKTRDSITRKVRLDAAALDLSEEEAVAKIGDALRGTLVVDDLGKISHVIAELMKYVEDKGAKIAFKNLWAEERESGYVGIHAKILFPVSASQRFFFKRQFILAEMQIHLDSIVDGTDKCAKERAHMLYEHVRLEDVNLFNLSAASKLLFLTAMQDILKSLEEKTACDDD